MVTSKAVIVFVMTTVMSITEGLFHLPRGDTVHMDRVCKMDKWDFGGSFMCKSVYQLNCEHEENGWFPGCHHTVDEDTGCVTCCCCPATHACDPACPHHCATDKHGCPLPGPHNCTPPPVTCTRKRQYCPRNCDSGDQGGYHRDRHGCVTCRCNNDPDLPVE